MSENIAGDAFRPDELYSERVCVVERSRGHSQTDHDAGALIERLRRKYQQRMEVLHFPASLGIAVDPDHIAAIWRPKLAARHQNTSLPTRVVTISSPACRTGSNVASFCASVSLGAPTAVTSTLDSCADTLTG